MADTDTMIQSQSNRTDQKSINQMIGHRVRVLRRLHDKNLNDIASYLNLSYQQVQKYEIGHNRISASALYSISQYLKCSPGDFFVGLSDTENATEIDEEVIELAARISKIRDEDSRRALTRLIVSLSDAPMSEA